MKSLISSIALLLLLLSPHAIGQEADDSVADDASAADVQTSEDTSDSPVTDAVDSAAETVREAAKKVDEAAEAFDASERAQEAAAGILQPIYDLAESFEQSSAFYWVAFAVMITGVVSFALQLVLGKLVALAKRSFNIAEILSDALGAIISLTGLVLTTQAATENSSFTSSALAVLSSSAVGTIAGFVFYVWGQRLELQAIEAQKQRTSDTPEKKG